MSGDSRIPTGSNVSVPTPAPQDSSSDTDADAPVAAPTSGQDGPSVPASAVFFGETVALDGTQVLLNGAPVDIDTPEVLAQLAEVMSAVELEALQEARALAGGGIPDGLDDGGASNAMQQLLGPASTAEGATETEDELAAVFEQVGIPNPRNANTTDALYDRVRGLEDFKKASDAAWEYLANPTPENQAKFLESVDAISGLNGNIMELLFLVFRESINETNEDKRYFLGKLQDFNKIAEGLTEYLGELSDKALELSEKGVGQAYPSKVPIDIEVKSFDLTTLGADGKIAQVGPTEHKTVTQAGLNAEIKDVEAAQETVRNNRQMASTAFQNSDQKANQMYNLIASVLKSKNEMYMGVTRNTN